MFASVTFDLRLSQHVDFQFKHFIFQLKMFYFGGLLFLFCLFFVGSGEELLDFVYCFYVLCFSPFLSLSLKYRIFKQQLL